MVDAKASFSDGEDLNACCTCVEVLTMALEHGEGTRTTCVDIASPRASWIYVRSEGLMCR